MKKPIPSKCNKCLCEQNVAELYCSHFGRFAQKKYRALYIFFDLEKNEDYECNIMPQG